MVLVSAGLQKSSDLVLSALVRARFCELLSPKVGQAESDLFLVGLVSMMDAILEVPMANVLEKIALDQDTKTLLTGGQGVLQPVYRLMLAQEAGAWSQARASAAQLQISETEAGQLWWQALTWARQVSSGK